MKKLNERILKSLNKLEGEIGKVYGECYCSKLIFTSEKLKGFLDSMENIKTCVDIDLNYDEKEGFSDEYQDYFRESILTAIYNNQNMHTLDSALDNYNKWAYLNNERKVSKLEFEYRLLDMDIQMKEDGTLLIPDDLK